MAQIPPKRAFELEIHIGANSWEEIMAAVREFRRELDRHGEDCKMATGGVAYGGWIKIEKNPGMTLDRYAKELEEYLDATRKVNHGTD